MNTKAILAATVLSAIGVLTPFAGAALTPGNLVVVQAGTDGSPTGLTNASTATFVKEFTTAGAFVQTIAMPTAAAGSNAPLTLSGTATSEGFITLSTNGQYLMLGGYATAPGLANVPTTSSTAGNYVNRVVGRIDMAGTIDTTTVLTDAYDGSNIRSATSTDGISIWTGGNGGSGLGASAGVKYTTLGGSTSTRLNDGGSNMRVVNIYNGQLYTSSATGTFQGISKVGTGLPTSGVQTNTLSLLPGFPTATGPSSYDFWFLNDTTLYVADDRATGSGGGVQKWTFDGTNWVLQYTLNSGLTGGARGLAGTIDGLGNAVLYATANSGAALVSVTDTGAGSAFSVLATAPTNTAFRGVELLPIPEPGMLSLIGLGGLLVMRRRSSVN